MYLVADKVMQLHHINLTHHHTLIKSLTGNESIAARFLFSEWFDFLPEFKIFYATNHKPVIKGTDQAIWDRIRLIPFGVRIPDEEQDKQLDNKLAAEAAGILAWAVRGCLDWQAHGLGFPSAVSAATADYRQEMDQVGNFVRECCIEGPLCSANAAELHDRYATWSHEQGDQPLSRVAFSRRLVERGFRKPERRGAGGRCFWLGLGILEGTELRSEVSEENEAISL